MPTITTRSGRTRLACGLMLTILALAVTASAAGAASPVITRQATSANSVFLAYAPRRRTVWMGDGAEGEAAADDALGGLGALPLEGQREPP